MVYRAIGKVSINGRWPRGWQKTPTTRINMEEDTEVVIGRPATPEVKLTGSPQLYDEYLETLPECG